MFKVAERVTARKESANFPSVGTLTEAKKLALRHRVWSKLLLHTYSHKPLNTTNLVNYYLRKS